MITMKKNKNYIHQDVYIWSNETFFNKERKQQKKRDFYSVFKNQEITRPIQKVKQLWWKINVFITNMRKRKTKTDKQNNTKLLSSFTSKIKKYFLVKKKYLKSIFLQKYITRQILLVSQLLCNCGLSVVVIHQSVCLSYH